MKFFVVLLVASLLLTGCMPLWSGRSLQDDVAEMEARQTELEAEAQTREETLAAMIKEARAEIDELEKVMEEAREILARDSANLGAEVSGIRQDINRTRGSLEEMEFLYGRLNESFEVFKEDMDRRFEGIDPEELLEKAQQFQEDEEYGLARRALNQFLADYDDHRLASEARLELGEVYFEIGHWESAGATFREVESDTSSAARRARATRRIGEVFMHLGDCDSAQLFFETVVSDFPRSAEVSDAREFLALIENGECPLE